MNLWFKICLGNKEKESWHDIILLSCVYAFHFQTPHSRAFSSHLKVVKTEIKLRLSSESLNSVMIIFMKGLSITKFKENYLNDCIDYWYNSKSWHLNQEKRKKYEDREATNKQRPNLNISDLESDYIITNGFSDEED